MKTCKYCKIEKPISDFFVSRPGVLSSRCKACHGLADRVCAVCGGHFVGSRSAKACSAECSSTFRPQTYRNCQYCGVLFGPLSNLRIKFCSIKCASAAKKGSVPWNTGKVCPNLCRAETRRCAVCDTEFRATSDYKHKRQIYCSHRCYLLNRRVSTPEKMVGEYLVSCGISALPQYRVGRWTFDYFIPISDLIVEVDGAFWHSSDTVKERDRKKEEECALRGWHVIRLDANAVMRDIKSTCNPVIVFCQESTVAARRLIEVRDGEAVDRASEGTSAVA